MRVLLFQEPGSQGQPLGHSLASDEFAVQHANSPQVLREVIDAEHTDVVVLDERAVTDPTRALGTLSLLRSHDPQIPIMLIVATGTDLLEAAVEAGADDYMAEPVSERIMAAHLKAIVRRSRWQTSVVAAS